MNGPPEGIDEQICLRGNHEQLMLDWHGQRDWLGSWLLNGGGQTRRSYGKDKARLQWHLKWLDELPCLHEETGYVFAHAGIVPGRPLAQQRNIDLI
jgi:serine/threonine protein phosphatase 1